MTNKRSQSIDNRSETIIRHRLEFKGVTVILNEAWSSQSSSWQDTSSGGGEGCKKQSGSVFEFLDQKRKPRLSYNASVTTYLVVGIKCDDGETVQHDGLLGVP